MFLLNCRFWAIWLTLTVAVAMFSMFSISLSILSMRSIRIALLHARVGLSVVNRWHFVERMCSGSRGWTLTRNSFIIKFSANGLSLSGSVKVLDLNLEPVGSKDSMQKSFTSIYPCSYVNEEENSSLMSIRESKLKVVLICFTIDLKDVDSHKTVSMKPVGQCVAIQVIKLAKSFLSLRWVATLSS